MPLSKARNYALPSDLPITPFSVVLTREVEKAGAALQKTATPADGNGSTALTLGDECLYLFQTNGSRSHFQQRSARSNNL
jgi:hypothetical protein